jgi:23S rRNA (uridine2552-2'-O)-methyltransferase
VSNRKLGDRDVRHDRFHQKAKREGFRARAVFKLQEIDEQFKLLPVGGRVLDLGCAPGSWLQYARTRVGERGVLVGIDRTELRPGVPGARVIVGDVLTIPIPQLLGELPAFDVVLSDMAPDTSGIRSMDQARSEALFERALEIAEQTLAPGGNFVGKIFQGPEFKHLIDRVRAGFVVGKAAKPDSSRKISIEQFVVGTGFRGRASEAANIERSIEISQQDRPHQREQARASSGRKKNQAS